MAEQKPRIQALGLDAEEFEAWRSHPTTKKVRKFYRDMAEAIRESWARAEGWTEELKVRQEDYVDFDERTFDEIKQFYDEREETDDA